MSVQTDYYIPELKKAEAQISRQGREITRLMALLDQIKTVCDDNASVPLQGRAMALQFVRDVAASAHEQKSAPIRCDGCDTGYADPPSKLCPGCQAYREHQS